MLKNEEKWHTKVYKKQLLCCFFIDLNVKIWYFISIQKKNLVKRSEQSMIDEEILELRRKLDESITKENNYEKIYKISVELDTLITKYYSKKLNDEVNSKI